MNLKERNKRQREARRLDNNRATKKYEKTINGFLMRMYRNMLSRVSGVQKEKYHLYKGLKLLSKEDFYMWAKGNVEFNALFNTWVDSGYARKLTPSVDRINSYEGYFIENMEFVTHSENSRRGSISKRRRPRSS